METSFARAAALNKTIRATKLKRRVLTQLAKNRSAADQESVAPQYPICADGPCDNQARLRRPVDDNVLLMSGPFILKKIYSKGVFTALSAECNKHSTCGDPNDSALHHDLPHHAADSVCLTYMHTCIHT